MIYMVVKPNVVINVKDLQFKMKKNDHHLCR
jgi:hypothetical protein